MSKLPATIKIFHRDYALQKQTLKETMHEPNMGMYKYLEGVLRYVADISPSESVDTIIHEILHALWRYFDHDNEIEEHIIETLATGLATVMRDNPKLFAALQDLIDKESTKKIDKAE